LEGRGEGPSTVGRIENRLATTSRVGCPSKRRTPFKTSEPEGVRNARSQLRTGAGEIGRAKITPTFETPLDGSDNLMSEWLTQLLHRNLPRHRLAAFRPKK
jgi:hypothetical protein